MIMIMIMVVVMVVMLMIFMALLAPLFMTLLASFFLAFLVTLVLFLMAQVLIVVLTLPLADVPGLVFPGPHEVHLPVARMILVAMKTPGARMLGRNVQIQRLCYDHL
jgi:hypothetical protein